MDFETAFLTQVICPFHPDFIREPTLAQASSLKPNAFNIPTLIEEALAFVGNNALLNSAGWTEHGRDFIDNTDSKTARVSKSQYYRKNKSGEPKLYTSFKLIIRGVEGKIGGLRVCAFNPFTGKIVFFFIPTSDVFPLSYNDSNRTELARRKIVANWTPETDNYNRLEKYRLATFEELAKIREDAKIELVTVNQL